MDFRQKFLFFILLISVFTAFKMVKARRRGGDIIILGGHGGGSGHHHHHTDHGHQSHQQTHILPVPVYMPYHCNCGHETYSSWGSDLSGYKK